MDRCQDRRRWLPAVPRIKTLGLSPVHLDHFGYYNTTTVR
jgi:hypothetical protein